VTDARPGRVPVQNIGRSVRWSWIFLLVSRASTFVAVPIIIDAAGTDLYATWVLAGTIVTAQGLVDFGLGAALVRFAAVARAEASRQVARTVLRRALALYLALSFAVGVPMLIWADELVGLVPYLSGADQDAAVNLVTYAAVTFGLTNLVLVFDGFLRGLNRISTSYRVQSAGWALFVPTLLLCFQLDMGIAAAGVAWLVSYGLQAVVLCGFALMELRRLPPSEAAPPSWSEMASIGGRWQVSSWADFATFQLPRIVGGVALSSSALVSIDLGLRFAQMLMAPLLAVYPVVLPTATEVWKKHGATGLATLLSRWYRPGAAALSLVVASAAPLAAPAISVWTGQKLTGSEIAVASMIAVAVAAHASTGLFSSALLATGNLGPVVRYKALQLAVGVPLVFLGGQLGLVALAASVSVALALPALIFNRQAGRVLRVPPQSDSVGRRAVVATALLFACGVLLVSTTHTMLPAGAVLAIGTIVLAVSSAGAAAACGLRFSALAHARQAG
jgi:O-antigen/teichoic acid export membrane protein